MPIGNGKVLGYVFAVDPVDGPTTISPSFILPTGVSFMVDMPEAMASDASLFSLGMVSLDTVPSMFTNEDWRLNFHQYLNASEGSVTVSTARASVKVWIEATTMDNLVLNVDETPHKFILNIEVPVMLSTTITDGGYINKEANRLYGIQIYNVRLSAEPLAIQDMQSGVK